MARSKNRFNALKNGMNECAKASEVKHKTALYARISVEHKDVPSESIETQLDLMRRFISDMPELGEPREYVDRNYSGTNFDRPAFNEMMSDVRAGRINCIIVKDLSRLGRNHLETSRYLETIFPFMKVRFISVNDKFDSEDPRSDSQALLVGIKNLFNDMVAKDVSKRVSTAKDLGKNQGKYIGSKAPYGYVVNDDDPLRHFLIDEKTASIVRELFKMAGEGITLRDISLEFQRRHINTPGEYSKSGDVYGESSETCFWRIGTLSQMLKNKVYIGYLIQGKRRQQLWNGEGQYNVDEDDWHVIPDAHEAIISEEEFNKVRKVFDKKLDESTFSSEQYKHLEIDDGRYSGLVYCAKCGAALQRASEVRGSLIKERRYYYFCGDNYRLGKKNCYVRITEKALDDILARSFSDALSKLLGKHSRLELNQILRSFISNSDNKYNQLKRKYLTAIKTSETRQVDLYTKFSLGRITREEFIAMTDSLAEQISEAEENLNLLEEKHELVSEYVSGQLRFISLLSAGVEDESKIDGELLRLLVRRINVTNRFKVEIQYAFSDPNEEGVIPWRDL